MGAHAKYLTIAPDASRASAAQSTAGALKKKSPSDTEEGSRFFSD